MTKTRTSRGITPKNVTWSPTSLKGFLPVLAALLSFQKGFHIQTDRRQEQLASE